MWSNFPLLSYRLFSLPNLLMHLFKAFSDLLAIWTVRKWLAVTQLLPLPLCFLAFDGCHIRQRHVLGQNREKALDQKAGGAAEFHSGTEHPMQKMEWRLNFCTMAASQFRGIILWRLRLKAEGFLRFCAMKDTTDGSFVTLPIPEFIECQWHHELSNYIFKCNYWVSIYLKVRIRRHKLVSITSLWRAKSHSE